MSLRALPLLLFLALAVTGCSGSTPSDRVARQQSAPVIASDSRLSPYIGDWAGDDGLELSIKRNADGSATVSLPPNSVWDLVVNNVRFDGTSLRYDLYFYYKGKENFTTITNTVGDHPYSGVLNEMVLTKGDISNTLKQRVVTKVTPHSIYAVLRRQGDK
jgi:hypothetical protein